MKEKVQAELKALETEFERVKQIGMQLQQQMQEAATRLTEIRGAHNKLSQLLDEDAAKAASEEAGKPVVPPPTTEAASDTTPTAA